MQNKLLTWACLLCLGHGRRLQTSTVQLQRDPSASGRKSLTGLNLPDSVPSSSSSAEGSQSSGLLSTRGLSALALLLLISKRAAFNPSAPGAHLLKRHPAVQKHHVVELNRLHPRLLGSSFAHQPRVIRLSMSDKPRSIAVKQSSSSAKAPVSDKSPPDQQIVVDMSSLGSETLTSDESVAAKLPSSVTGDDEFGFGAADNLMAVLALNAVTIIWGSQHAVIKDLVEACPPAAVNAVRFSFAALLAAPFLPGAPWNREASTPLPSEASTDGTSLIAEEQELSARAVADDVQATWLAGLELGIWMFAGFALQAFGLQFTTASRSAFLLYLNVKLVPLLNLLLYGRQSDAKTWLSAFIACAGTTLLSFDGAPPNLGDAFSLAAAATSAMFILRLESASQAHDPAKLNAATLASSAFFCLLWAVVDLTLVEPERITTLMASFSENIPQFAYLSLIVTALANYLQTVGQAGVRAQDAAIIYSLDPVYGAAFSWLLLGETLGPQGFAGGILVLAAVALSRSNFLEGNDDSQSVGNN